MAAVDYFLKLDGIDGEVTAAGHEKWIEVESFSWGASNPTTIGSATGGAGAGKVQMQDFSFVLPFSKASLDLFMKCATGERIREATLSASRIAGGQLTDFIKWRLSDCLVSSYQSTGSENAPTDSLSLAFAKIELTDMFIKGETGTPLSVGWDVVQNKSV
jgi:type VI secretion system secreted protein Hcp